MRPNKALLKDIANKAREASIDPIVCGGCGQSFWLVGDNRPPARGIFRMYEETTIVVLNKETEELIQTDTSNCEWHEYLPSLK